MHILWTPGPPSSGNVRERRDRPRRKSKPAKRAAALKLLRDTARLLLREGVHPHHVRRRLHQIRDSVNPGISDRAIENFLWRLPEARRWLPTGGGEVTW